jgi:hypothetical protein
MAGKSRWNPPRPGRRAHRLSLPASEARTKRPTEQGADGRRSLKFHLRTGHLETGQWSGGRMFRCPALRGIPRISVGTRSSWSGLRAARCAMSVGHAMAATQTGPSSSGSTASDRPARTPPASSTSHAHRTSVRTAPVAPGTRGSSKPRATTGTVSIPTHQATQVADSPACSRSRTLAPGAPVNAGRSQAAAAPTVRSQPTPGPAPVSSTRAAGSAPYRSRNDGG